MKRKFEQPIGLQMNPEELLIKFLYEYLDNDSDKSQEEWLKEQSNDGEVSAFFYKLNNENLNKAFQRFNELDSMNYFLELITKMGYFHIVVPAINFLEKVDYEELHEIITDSILAAAYYNHFEIVTYLLKYVAANYPNTHEGLVNETFQVLAREGKIKAVHFFMHSNLPIDPSSAIYEALDQFDIVKFIALNTKVSLNLPEIQNAVQESNNSNVVQFLVEKFCADPSANNNQCIRNAYTNKNFPLVLYLASLPRVMETLDAKHQEAIATLKHNFKNSFDHELRKYRTNYCMFFSHFSKLYVQNTDVQTIIRYLGLIQIQNDFALNDQALNFVLN
ncbi:MAG: hypothetical protein H0U57_11595 [Tatlockia sp.]|nr:hypothetical protein [Tatlockia sp.]